MKILHLLLVLLATSQCQELMLENWLNSDAGFSKFFVKPNYDWSRTKDFAVYGWFKIDPNVSLANEGILFHLTSNVSGDASFNTKIGDFVFGVLYKDQKLSLGTYSSPNIPYYKVDVKVRTKDLGKWAYFYVGYSGASQKLVYRFEFNELYIVKGSISGVKHNLSTYYKLFVGSQLKFSKFPGQISQLHLHAGQGAYREYNHIKPFNPYKFTCPVVFDECGFKGNYYVICTDGAHVPLTFPIRSIYLPNGYFMGIQITDYIIPIDISTACLEYETIHETRQIFVQNN